MARSNGLDWQLDETLRLLGARIRLARLRRNLTQAEVAVRVGISRKTYIELEQGAPAKLSVLGSVLAVFGYPTRLADVLESDPLGEDLEAFHGPRRRGGRSDLADF